MAMRWKLKHLVPLTLLLVLGCWCGDAGAAGARAALLLSRARSKVLWRIRDNKPVAASIDPLANVEHLSECLYNQGNLSCIAQYCRPGVVVHGDGVFLPRTSFVGVPWAVDLHREWLGAYPAPWHMIALEAAATQGGKGFTEAFLFFHWRATNTGPYHGQSPTGRESRDYGILRVATDKGGLVTDVTLWRGGFAEEREALLVNASDPDPITSRRAITDQPWWVPSQSLQLRMVTRAHTLLEVLNQGEKFLDGLDDLAAPGVELIDGARLWDPALAAGLPSLKLWFAGWLQGYGSVSAAATGSAVTTTSNKVFLCFRLLLSPQQGPGTLFSVDGCSLLVFNINGYITHLVVWRNGTPKEMEDKFIAGGGRPIKRPGAVTLRRDSSSGSSSRSHSSSSRAASSSVLWWLHRIAAQAVRLGAMPRE